jgi:hypothetical protein
MLRWKVVLNPAQDKASGFLKQDQNYAHQNPQGYMRLSDLDAYGTPTGSLKNNESAARPCLASW